MDPEISVVMAVFNHERFVVQAVESVLNQSITDFEFIIVDDGSSDGTSTILDTCHDPRIVRLRNESNIGLTRSLNRGLQAVRGSFIARQDADDISLPDRLERQVAFMHEHPDVGLVGSSCSLIDQEGKRLGRYQPRVSDLRIRWVSLLTNPFAHPTVLFRRQLLAEHGLSYNESLETAQDYALWLQFLEHAKGANISDVLMLYRKGGRITTQKRKLQLETEDALAFGAIRKQFRDLPVTQEKVSQLRALIVGAGEPPRSADRIPLARLYLDLFDAFVSAHREAPADELEVLRREEALRVARSTLRCFGRSGWSTVMRRLLFLDFLLPWSLSCYFFKFFRRNFAFFVRAKSL